jgi:hypothetical protein
LLLPVLLLLLCDICACACVSIFTVKENDACNAIATCTRRREGKSAPKKGQKIEEGEKRAEYKCEGAERQERSYNRSNNEENVLFRHVEPMKKSRGHSPHTHTHTHTLHLRMLCYSTFRHHPAGES